jgi:hypothetical protein
VVSAEGWSIKEEELERMNQIVKMAVPAMGKKLLMSTAWHPQPDGALGRENQGVESGFRAKENI